MNQYLEVKSINKTFLNKKKENTVLKNINFSIDKGDFICIVGQSGCGKSTLLRIMSGLEQATSGKVICQGKKIEKPSRKHVYIFQDFNQLLPWKTVRQNIMYPMLLNNKDSLKNCIAKVEEYLKLIGLENFYDYYPHELSGGMRQKIALARALAADPEVIYMDEPFSAVDAHIREKLQNRLLTVWKQLNLTIVFVTHNIEEAIRLSNKIIVLGGKPARTINIIENKVKGEKMPTDEGFSELWNILHDSMR